MGVCVCASGLYNSESDEGFMRTEFGLSLFVPDTKLGFSYSPLWINGDKKQRVKFKC